MNTVMIEHWLIELLVIEKVWIKVRIESEKGWIIVIGNEEVWESDVLLVLLLFLLLFLNGLGKLKDIHDGFALQKLNWYYYCCDLHQIFETLSLPAVIAFFR